VLGLWGEDGAAVGVTRGDGGSQEHDGQGESGVMKMGRGNAKRSTKIKRPMKTDQQRAQELGRSIGVPEAQIGSLALGKIVDLSGELGERMKTYDVLVNRGGTAIERWIGRDPAGLFGEPQQRAIRYTQKLWARADNQLRATDHARDVVDGMVEGMSQQEALDELQRLKDRTPRLYWDVYENVCRFDEEAGRAGSRLATNSRSSDDGCVHRQPYRHVAQAVAH